MTTRYKRPWRIEFNWDNSGIKGTDTVSTPREAIRKRAEMIERSETTGSPLTVVLRNRDTGEIIPMPERCTVCRENYAHPDPAEYDNLTACRPCRDAAAEQHTEQREFVNDVIRLVHRSTHQFAKGADSVSGHAEGYTVTVTACPDVEFITGAAYQLSALTTGVDPIRVEGKPFPLPAVESAAAWLHTLLKQAIEIPASYYL